jgi:hypothetical protein
MPVHFFAWPAYVLKRKNPATLCEHTVVVVWSCDVAQEAPTQAVSGPIYGGSHHFKE